MRKWVYEASLDWLKERKEALTATDVVSLLPELKRVRKNGMEAIEAGGKKLEYSLMCAKLWAEKTGSEELDPAAPSDAAARGHVLEPFAVREFNRLAGSELHAWDDMLIVREDGLGFSPDALDMEQPCAAGSVCVLPAAAVDDPTKMVEVKSYEARKHIEKMLEPKEQHVERYQVAVAMAVLPNLQVGGLVFYNPSSSRPIVVHTYRRTDLESEIADVEDVVSMYNTTVATLDNEDVGQWFPCEFDEETIWQVHMRQVQDAMGVRKEDIGKYIDADNAERQGQ